MRTTTTRWLAIAMVTVATVTLAACSDDPKAPAAQQETPAAESSAPEEGSADAMTHNDADTEFAQMMIIHHRGALEMAELAVEKASSEDVRTLADQIVQAQDPEIRLMTRWLETWGEELPDTAEHGGMDHGGMEMEGMDQGEAMAELEQLSGADFDRRFLELMTEHHRGAVEMSQELLETGENADARELAEKIIQDQEAEISTMEGLLQEL